jgi:hypothetical protein
MHYQHPCRDMVSLQEDTWVALSGLQDKGIYEKYITALYWSMSTLCTVGYGDVTPGGRPRELPCSVPCCNLLSGNSFPCLHDILCVIWLRIRVCTIYMCIFQVFLTCVHGPLTMTRRRLPFISVLFAATTHNRLQQSAVGTLSVC